MSKNVVIIGAGIAGLSAGVYSARSGFKTTILESHIIPCPADFLQVGSVKITFLKAECTGSPVRQKNLRLIKSGNKLVR